jgi:integrase
MPKLTKRTVDALKPREKAYIAYDSELYLFGVRVMPSGHKSFIIEYRPHGGGRAVATRRLTLGAYGALTPDRARRAAQEALARVRLGEDPHAEKVRQRGSLTVGGLIDAFIVEHVGKKCKAGTAYGYEIALKRLRDAHGSLKADALTRAHIAALHSSLANTPYAANRFLAVVSKCFSWATDRGLVPEGHVNPASRIERYREQGHERFLTNEELARLGDVLREGETIGLPYGVDESKPTAKHAPKVGNRRVKLDPYAVAAVRLLILTGARFREILDAKWEHVDFERGILFLPDSKTGRKPVYLSAAALAIIASLPRLEGNPHLIAGMKDGAPRVDLKKPWAAITKAAGLEGLRIHDLRHSYASVGAGASLGLPIIGKLLGHSQAATTHRYAHLDADPLKRAAETIGATIVAAMGGASAGLRQASRSQTVVPMTRLN